MEREVALNGVGLPREVYFTKIVLPIPLSLFSDSIVVEPFLRLKWKQVVQVE